MNTEKIKEILNIICIPLSWVFGIIKKHHDIINLLLTAIAIYVATILYFETKEQVKIAHDALEYQKFIDSCNGIEQRIKDSATIAIAETSNVFTRKSAKVYEYLTKTDLRAYLVIDKVGQLKFVTNDSLNIRYSIMNIGKTPAKNAIAFHCIICGNPSEAEMNHFAERLKGSIDRNSQKGFVLGANRPSDRDAGVNGISRLDSLLIAQNKKKVYLFVLIRYFDIFSEIHYTWGCFGINIFNQNLEAYPRHNNAN